MMFFAFVCHPIGVIFRETPFLEPLLPCRYGIMKQAARGVVHQLQEGTGDFAEKGRVSS
jgi:hypothetical protein